MTKNTVFSTYRTLSRLIKRLPEKQKPSVQLKTLHETYRKNASLTDSLQIEECIREAGEKIAYLRIITPKPFSDSRSGGNGKTRIIYTKDGAQEVDNSTGNRRDSSGRVVSNWDGSNLDPCSVKTHNQQLRRAGFVNNLHAKGIF